MDIKDIKLALKIEVVLTHYNLVADKNNRLCCPWHNDKTPSLQIYRKTNTWTCFSHNCTAGSGDTIEMIQRMEKGTKHEAILKAKSLLNYSPTKTQNQKGMKENQSENLQELYDKMRAGLLKSKKAQNYLETRNLPTTSDIGYNSYQSGYKQLQNCIVFPLKDRENNIVSLYGRSVSDLKGSNHYYLKNRTGLYPNYPAAATKTIIITEAVIDATTMEAHGGNHEAILALYGTNGWTEEHTNCLSVLTDLEEVIFFFDGDEAGNKAIETYSTLVKSMKPTIKISKVNTPAGEDINSLVISHEVEILQHLINERIFLFCREAPTGNNKEKKTTQTSNSDLDISNKEYIKWSKYNLAFTLIGGVGLYPLDRLKVTIKIKRKDSNHPMHSLRQGIDLYQDDLVEKLARKIAERLEIGSSKVHESLLELTGLLEHYREIENEKRQKKEVIIRELTPQRIETAQAFLSAKNLDERTRKAIAKTGLIGEEKNGMTLWYVFTSRLREQPLHAMCLGASGTGKTYLQERIGALIPKHQKKEITAMSDNAMYYFEEKELVHKLLLIEDLDGANEQKILYALRELMSKKYISKTIVIKDSKGNLKTITLEVRGPICLAGTTTRERLYEDNSNRSLLIYLDNSKAQRERIMAYQRKDSAGKVNKYEENEMVEFMQDIQSVLKPVRVVNPYAEQLIIPEQVFKPLRTNSHYLQFIESVTFYHQYQREKKYDQRGIRYIETTIEDIEIANELLKEVLLAKSDELTKATRRFYETLKAYTNREKKESFYSGEIRRAYRMTPATVGRHLKILARYGYVKVVSGSKKKGYEYEIEKEVDDLRSKITTALDEVLERIKQRKNK